MWNNANIYNTLYIGKSYNYPSNVKPNFNISKVNKSNIDSILYDSYKSLDTSKLKLISINDKAASFVYLFEDNKLIFNINIINSRNQTYQLTTMFAIDSNYENYKLILNTITKSFKPF